MKQRLIRFDWAIKRLLRNKANFSILEGFLSELLHDDIKIDSILESESNKQTGDNKSNRVDLLIKNKKGELVIIEIQSNRMQDYLMRMLYGTSKLIVDNLDKGMDYNEIKKVISINIVYFDLGVGKDYIYYGTTNFIGLHENDTLKLSGDQEKIYHTIDVSKLYPEYYIIKVNQFNDIAQNSLDEWIYFLKNEEIKDEFKAKGLKEAKEGLDILKLSDADRMEYESFITDWRDFNSYTVGNFRAGKFEGQFEIAERCLAKGMSIEETAELTGLLVEDVVRMMK